MQTFGDFPDRFHPHLHILCSDGVFYRRGVFQVAPKFNLKDLEQVFRHKDLRMLLARGRITREMIRMMGGWRHSGFNVYAGPRIHPRQKRSLENLAAYLIRSSFSQQRMEYLPDQAKVAYRSKDGKEKKTYDALEWMAAMGSHVPERGQHSVRYYGAYANSTRGREQKRGAVEEIPTVLEPDLCSREVKRNWSRLIQKVYETDPLACPRCEHPMRVIASIEDPKVIRRILEHLARALAHQRPARTQGTFSSKRVRSLRGLLLPIACLGGGRLLPTAPRPMGMLNRPASIIDLLRSAPVRPDSG